MKFRHKQAPGAVDLIEEALHLLRETPFRVWVLYYTGTVPFVLGFLYFWADMAQSAFAAQRAGGAALGMVLLYFWMKTFQARFAAELHASMIGVPAAPGGWREWGRTFVDQLRFQGWGLLFVPLGLVLVLPGAFVFGYFQFLTVLPEDGRSKALRAWKEATRWPAEDFMMQCLLLLLWFMLALNLLFLVFVGPQLLKSLFDYETLFSRSPWTAMNTTLMMALVLVSWLCWDPLVKAVYVLRMFRGEGRESGVDLVARLRHAVRRAGTVVALAVGLMLAPGVNAATDEAASSDPEPAAAPATAEEIDRSIRDVLQQGRYNWRIPREAIVEETKEKSEGAISRWIRSLTDSLGAAAKKVARWIADLFQPRTRTNTESNISFADAAVVLKWFLILLIVVILGALVWLLVKAWINRPRVAATAAAAVPAMPDVSDENVGADQLPEDGWMRLAMELMGKGDFRLALRALYLASLAHLAQRELVRLARHKSNRDYVREVDRRARAVPELVAAFQENVGAFDRVWYGRHEATDAVVQSFRANVERIRAC